MSLHLLLVLLPPFLKVLIKMNIHEEKEEEEDVDDEDERKRKREKRKQINVLSCENNIYPVICEDYKRSMIGVEPIFSTCLFRLLNPRFKIIIILVLFLFFFLSLSLLFCLLFYYYYY